MGRANLPHVCAQAAKGGLMIDEIALEGQYSYGCHVSSILTRHGDWRIMQRK